MGSGIRLTCKVKGRHQNSHPLSRNFTQKLTQPCTGISYPVGDLCRRFTKQLCPLPIHYITDRLPMFPQHIYVILLCLWGILMSPLNPKVQFCETFTVICQYLTEDHECRFSWCTEVAGVGSRRWGGGSRGHDPTPLWPARFYLFFYFFIF